MQKEYELRRKNGIELEYLEKKEIEKLFPFSAPAGLLSKVSGQVDAYQLAHALLKELPAMGGSVYNQTEIKNIQYHDDWVELRTEDDCQVRTKRLVIAAGYESQTYLKQKVENLNSSYAIISEPMPAQDFWHENCLVWETARPYLYMRTTSDYRILIGGRDEKFYNPDKRDRLIEKKADQLEKILGNYFPMCPSKPIFAGQARFRKRRMDCRTLASRRNVRSHTLRSVLVAMGSRLV